MKTTTTILALATASAFTAGAFIASASSAVGTPPEVRASVESSANAEAGHAVIAATTAPDYRAIVQQYGPAVVGITVEGKVATAPDFARDPFFRFYRGLPIPPMPNGEVPMHGQGSGFIVDADGLILTNAHVVRDASTVTVKLADRREFEARVLGVDPATDVAVLKIEASGLPTVALGDPSRLAVGDPVLAIGSPFGFEQSATAGIVSAKGRSLPRENYVPFIQTDVAINPGNSGGPLFNLEGEVVGVNSQIYSRTGGFMGLSFAIPIELAMDVADQLKRTGRVQRGWLGILIQDVTRELAESFGMARPAGALVAQVMAGSPAHKAGIRVGDVVIEYDGREIGTSAELPPLVGRSGIGESITVKVMRDGKPRTLKVSVGELPEEASAEALEERPPEASPGQTDPQLGLTVDVLAPEQREALGAPGGGVLVTQVEPGPAQEAGLAPGDIITKLGQREVNGLDDFRAAAKALPAGKSIPVLVIREGSPRFLALKLPDGNG